MDGSVLALLGSQSGSQRNSSVTAESCDRKSENKWIPFLNLGRGGIFMCREKLPVIKNISHTRMDSSPVEIRWFKPGTRRNTSLLQLGDRIYN